jgi:hypothetical protein
LRRQHGGAITAGAGADDEEVEHCARVSSRAPGRAG